MSPTSWSGRSSNLRPRNVTSNKGCGGRRDRRDSSSPSAPQNDSGSQCDWPGAVMQSPLSVILSGAKDLRLSLRVNSANDPEWGSITSTS